MRTAALSFLALLALLWLASPVAEAATDPSCMPTRARRDCGYWDAGSCEANGCCWGPLGEQLQSSTNQSSAASLRRAPAHLVGGTPWCYRPQQTSGGYALQSVDPLDTPNPGWRMLLKLYDGTGYFGKDAPMLAVDVHFETRHRMRLRVHEPERQRWEIPEWMLPLAPANKSLRVEDAYYRLDYTVQPFGFAVSRVEDGQVLFNSTPPVGPDGRTPLFNGLTFNEQYLELSTQLPNDPYVYGLGERMTSLRLQADGRPMTMWARDDADPEDRNIYGSHPVYFEQRMVEGKPKMHAVWLRNSNGMDVSLRSADAAIRDFAIDSGNSRAPRSLAELQTQRPDLAADQQYGYLTYRVIGGVLDLHFYVGSEADGSNQPEVVTRLHHESVGFPHMPPMWALGFHQCRWGYPTLQHVKDVVWRYKQADIPLDTMWTDIDYMGPGPMQYEDFTTDGINFPEDAMKAWIDELHAMGMKYVLILDPAIHNRTGSAVFESGLQKDVFIRRHNGELFVGKVWPGYTAFPSYFAPQTDEWWSGLIADFRRRVPVDGLWIDMNEAANFCNGHCDAEGAAQAARDSLVRAAEESERRGRKIATYSSKALKNTGADDEFNPNDPPFRIANGGGGDPLNVKALDVDAVHPNGELEYNTHNLYGLSEAIVTLRAMEKQTGKRSFVLSRSTFSGSGKYGGHWGGDNWSNFRQMHLSIPQMLSTSMFGISFNGADICGFGDSASEELCARWMELGAFYPFSRNHNGLGHASQEPYVWESVAQASRLALGWRYQLLHLYNTLLFEANQRGGTVVRPLFFHFAHDQQTWDLERQFLIGDSVLVTPVLEEGARSVWGYFPRADSKGDKQNWYDLRSLEPLVGSDNGWYELDAPLTHIPLHVRGGSVLTLQQPALTTVAQRKKPFRVVVALQSDNTAQGTLFLDDGDTLEVGTNSLQATYSYSNNTLSYRHSRNDYAEARELWFESVQFAGVQSGVSIVRLDGTPVPFQHNPHSGVLTVPVQIPLAREFTMQIQQ